jgi:AraC-like DNA-binding protein
MTPTRLACPSQQDVTNKCSGRRSMNRGRRGIVDHRCSSQDRRMQSIEVAETRLRDGDRSLADIAFTAGFGGQAHLTTAFRLAKGVTPGRYRRGLALPRSLEQTTSMEERA